MLLNRQSMIELLLMLCQTIFAAVKRLESLSNTVPESSAHSKVSDFIVTVGGGVAAKAATMKGSVNRVACHRARGMFGLGSAQLT